MRALGFRNPTPTLCETSFLEFEVTDPDPKQSDLLVEVRATSINPVDY